MRISGSNPEGMAVAPSPGGVGCAVCVLTITMTTPGSSKLVHAPSPDPVRSAGSGACDRGCLGRLVALARERAMREWGRPMGSWGRPELGNSPYGSCPLTTLGKECNAKDSWYYNKDDQCLINLVL